MRTEEIHLIQGDTIHTTAVVIDLKIKATGTIKKTTFSQT